jgi:ectoine hydroxylase-related dioxygenase (phytanoyl-CoA dioxygenase family)
MSEPARQIVPAAGPLADRSAFLRDGFTIVRGALDPADLAQVNADMGELFVLQLRARGLPVDAGASREAWQANAQRLLAVDVEAYINTARMTQMVPSAHRVMTSDPILQIARDVGVEIPVICTRLSNHIMSDALKIPGGYHKSPPHQDWRSMQGSLDSIVMWVPTTPVSLDTHPLQVIPRSHLWGLAATVDHIQTPAVSDPRATEDAYVGLPMQPGDVVVFSSFLVHRTGEHGDGNVRIAFSTRFNNAAEPTFVGHGYPTPYKYGYRTDLMFENFPTLDDVATIFPDAVKG